MQQARYLSIFERIPTWCYLLLLSALLFLPFLGNAHLFDWDEINFAEAAREMLQSGHYSRVQINYQPFWEKPPLFIWMQVLSMKLFGVGEYAARFPNALCGMATVQLLFYFGKRWKDSLFGLLWVFFYLGSFLSHFYFKSGIIDPWFNFFIFSALLCWIESFRTGQQTNSYKLIFPMLSGVSIGLAVMSKGPVAILLFAISTCVIFLLGKGKYRPAFMGILLFICSMLIVSLSWFAFETIAHGTWFLHEFIDYQLRLAKTRDAGHGGPFFYHPLVVFLGCFPASIFALWGLKRGTGDSISDRILRISMIVLLLVVLIIFSLVKTKIVHYSSLTYYPLTCLAAWAIHRMKTIPKALSVALALVGAIWTLLLLMLPIAAMHVEHLKFLFNKDPFALANLDAAVYWSYADLLIGFVLLMILLLWFFIRMKDIQMKTLLFLMCMTPVIGAMMVFIVPRIERYSQGAAIDFYQQKANEGAIVEVFGYKSYAHLFYTKRTSDKAPENLDAAMNKNWPCEVYVVAKINRAVECKQVYKVQEIYRSNGFVFFKKLP